jgi:hypothetical protein
LPRIDYGPTLLAGKGLTLYKSPFKVQEGGSSTIELDNAPALAPTTQTRATPTPKRRSLTRCASTTATSRRRRRA